MPRATCENDASATRRKKQPASEASSAALRFFVRILATLFLGISLVVPGSAGTHAENLSTEKQHDTATALQAIKPLAEEGDAFAQLAIGIMYFNGWDAPRDYVQARMWFNLASFRTPIGPDQQAASLARDLVGARMTPAQIDEAQKLTQEWFADLEQRPAQRQP